jgi:hypothetical protein
MGPLQITATDEQRYHDQHLDLDLDFGHKTALLDTKPLGLTRTEYALLALLIQNAGQVVTRETLLLRVWGYSNQIRTRTLDVHIRRLRKKLGQHSGTYIETIFNVGYRFQPFRASRFIQGAPQITALLDTKPVRLTRKEYDLLALSLLSKLAASLSG